MAAGRLTQEVINDLVARHGSLRLAAIAEPQWAEAIARYQDDLARLMYGPTEQAAQVSQPALAGAAGFGPPERATQNPPAPEDDRRRRPIPPEQLLKAGRAYRKHGSVRAVETRSGLSRSGRGKLVAQLMDLGLFDWDPHTDRLVFRREISATPNGEFILPTLAEAAALLKSRR